MGKCCEEEVVDVNDCVAAFVSSSADTGRFWRENLDLPSVLMMLRLLALTVPPLLSTLEVLEQMRDAVNS